MKKRQDVVFPDVYHPTHDPLNPSYQTWLSSKSSHKPITSRMMRDNMVVLPMLMGCVSPSSLDVLNPSFTQSKARSSFGSGSDWNSHTSKKQEKTEERLLGKIPRNSRRYHSFPKANIAGGLHKLIQRSSKSLSRVFVYKQGDGDEDENEEQEMVIGAPTEVKHENHIGIGQSCDTIFSTSINQLLKN